MNETKMNLKDFVGKNIYIYDMKHVDDCVMAYFKLANNSKQKYVCELKNPAALKLCIPICEELELKPLFSYTKDSDTLDVYYPECNTSKKYNVVDGCLCAKLVD